MTSGIVLVVEDNQKWQDSYEEWLTRKKHQVVIAPSKQAALTSIAQHAFDVAIIDVNLSVAHGNRDGLEVAYYLKENHPKTHIIIVSGSLTPELLTELKDQGLDFIPRNELQYKAFMAFVQEKIEQAQRE